MELDPYKILNVPYNSSLENIRNNFKKLVLKHHPDRGGNPQIFDLIKNAYTYLYKYKIEQKKQLEKERMNFEKYTSKRNFETEHLDREFQKLKINPNDKNLDMNKFNKIFEEHKIEDADSRGYEYKRDNNRLDPEELMKKYSNKQKKKLEIQVYEEPEPIELTNENYKKLGLKHVKDFSQKYGNKGSQYTDFQKAYTEYDNTTMKNYRKKEYSIEEYRNMRNNQNFEMSESEKRKMKIKQQQELEMEEKRRYYLSKNDEKIFKNFKKFQNFLM
jgi:curved DNA-binding protein CbpA